MGHARAASVGLRWTTVIGGGLAAALCLVPVPGFPQVPEPPDRGVNNRNITDELNANAAAAERHLKPEVAQLAKARDKFKEAKRKADDAEAAADRALEAAKKCETESDRKKAKALIDEANKKLAEAYRAGAEAYGAANAIDKDVTDTVNKVNARVNELESTAAGGIQAAEKAGLKANSSLFGKWQLYKDAVDQEVAKARFEGTKDKQFSDQGSLDRLKDVKSEFLDRIAKLKKEFDANDAERRAEEKLKAADAYLDKCPSPQAAAPAPPVEVTAGLDGRQKVNVGVCPGQDAKEVTGQLGLTDGRVIAQGPGGAIVQATGDAKTVEKTAKDKGIHLCFVEADFCLVFTPETPPREGDFEAVEPPRAWVVRLPPTVPDEGPR